jgi:hypothetical protein
MDAANPLSTVSNVLLTLCLLVKLPSLRVMVMLAKVYVDALAVFRH